MSEWQPISTAPKDGTAIDIWAKFWDARTDTFEGKRSTDCRWIPAVERWSGVDRAGLATHWMHIPEPPK